MPDALHFTIQGAVELYVFILYNARGALQHPVLLYNVALHLTILGANELFNTPSCALQYRMLYTLYNAGLYTLQYTQCCFSILGAVELYITQCCFSLYTLQHTQLCFIIPGLLSFALYAFTTPNALQC